jgi:hypothetical protein
MRFLSSILYQDYSIKYSSKGMEIGFRSDLYEHFMLEKGLQLVDRQLGLDTSWPVSL